MVVSITLSLGLIPVPDDAERQRLHPSIDDRYKKFSGMMFKKKKKKKLFLNVRMKKMS